MLDDFIIILDVYYYFVAEVITKQTIALKI